MPKLHLLMKKEEIDEEKMKDNKIAVVFDVLLATSTITSGLYFGAKEVIPVLNGEAAKKEAEGRIRDSYALVGEYEGVTIEGFLDPNPLKLKEHIKDKTMILSTTNGTVAINKASEAKKVYICSLLNGSAVADTINRLHKDETLVVICSGSGGEFCIEDFYGAGYFLDCLLNNADNQWNLTDAALSALLFYRGNHQKSDEVLLTSRVGQMLSKYGFEEEVQFVGKHGFLPIVPYLSKGKVVV
ncbi:2-phosphosulfolactate phosphatase [Cytobacillus sp. S13-E01]|uniref:2-phosphosulfolactate phosphatase n=1 Tax=Cytobacillus sp. S13-E01 TaxID=3031326 RepID=UPI0023D7CC83|nr:2-phosphosulfolactate phosphatase [Cytobacillus sp. S13-E01]MDF0725420.1 2-phosphosulfolactate phosphatase [Cytobacillus sp. S13-E01]